MNHIDLSKLAAVIGKPYSDRGRGPDSFDCYGLFIYANLAVFGREVPDFKDYSESHNFESVSSCINQHKLSWHKVEYENRNLGNAIVLCLRNMPIHIGLVLDEKRMLHTLPGRNACIEEYTSVQWRNRIEGFYEWTN